MKFISLLSILVISTSAMSSELLLRYRTGSGFSPVPRSSTIQITDDGKVTLLETERKLSHKTEIATLTESSLENLKAKIETIDNSTTLIDIDASKPRCMDAPSSSLIVAKGGLEVEIYAKRSCHRYFAKDAEVEKLVNLVFSFQYLTF